MSYQFATAQVTGKRWYSGLAWFFEFKADGVSYLGAAVEPDFGKAVVIELIPGQELRQMRELEQEVTA